jgi:SAM-dependent methyltransferase
MRGIDVHREIYEGLFHASPARLSYTRKAFQMLPQLDSPRILDVGCGLGGPTLELARLSGGQVVGLDVDQSSLDGLSERIKEEGLSDQVQVVRGSMFDLDFPDESFDVIWAEGSMHIVGFEKALGEWRRFIRPRGFLVAHEGAWLRPDPPQEIMTCPQLAFPGMRTVSEYVDQIPGHGYDLIGHFALPEDFWWLHYFGPVEGRIQELRAKYAPDRAIQEALDQEQRIVDLYKKHARWYGSAFLVMQKSDHPVRTTAERQGEPKDEEA